MINENRREKVSTLISGSGLFIVMMNDQGVVDCTFLNANGANYAKKNGLFALFVPFAEFSPISADYPIRGALY